jgi:hypothetical protein
MNMFFQKKGEAKLHYGSSDFTILEGGGYVTCATTGAHIPLEELRYWNDDRQEAYKDADAALVAFQKAGEV